jgi:hypothetical protein
MIPKIRVEDPVDTVLGELHNADRIYPINKIIRIT